MLFGELTVYKLIISRRILLNDRILRDVFYFIFKVVSFDIEEDPWCIFSFVIRSYVFDGVSLHR